MKRIAYISCLLGMVGCGLGRESAVEKACQLWTSVPVAVTASDTSPPAVLQNSRYEVALPLVGIAAGSGWGRVSFAAPFNSQYVVATSPGVTLDINAAPVTALGPICEGQADGHTVVLTAVPHDLRLGNPVAASTGLVIAENRSRRQTSGGGGGDLDFD
jgi:hypothetical protein